MIAMVKYRVLLRQTRLRAETGNEVKLELKFKIISKKTFFEVNSEVKLKNLDEKTFFEVWKS